MSSLRRCLVLLHACTAMLGRQIADSVARKAPSNRFTPRETLCSNLVSNVRTLCLAFAAPARERRNILLDNAKVRREVPDSWSQRSSSKRRKKGLICLPTRIVARVLPSSSGVEALNIEPAALACLYLDRLLRRAASCAALPRGLRRVYSLSRAYIRRA